MSVYILSDNQFACGVEIVIYLIKFCCNLLIKIKTWTSVFHPFLSFLVIKLPIKFLKQSLIAHACNCFTNAWVPLSKSVGAMATYFRLRWERHLIYTKGQLQFYGRLKACIFREIFSSLFNMHLSKVNYYNQTFFIAVL